jgi:cytochrome c oxidase subunit III
MQIQDSAIDTQEALIQVGSHEAQGVHGDHGDHAHPDLRTMGLITFLMSETLMFGALFAVYLVLRSRLPVWPPEGTEVELLLPALNTSILIASSFVIHKGEEAIKKDDVAGMQFWYLLTAGMGIFFLCGQVYEYMHLSYGLSTNTFSNCFYLMTGFHGLHVFIGVCMILGVWWRSRTDGHYSSVKHTGIEMAEVYWHFVDVIWIVMFSLIYVLTKLA